MNVAEVVLVYVAIPAGVTGTIAALVFGPGLVRRPRYRPGDPWQYEPVWYGPHPQMLDGELQELLAGTHDAGSAAPALTTRSRPAITGPGAASEDPVVPGLTDLVTARGGAHGDW